MLPNFQIERTSIAQTRQNHVWQKQLLSFSPNFAYFLYLFSERFIPRREFWALPLHQNEIFRKVVLIDHHDGDSMSWKISLRIDCADSQHQRKESSCDINRSTIILRGNHSADQKRFLSATLAGVDLFLQIS